MSDARLRELERAGDTQALAIARYRALLCPWCGGPRCEGLGADYSYNCHVSHCCCCSHCYEDRIGSWESGSCAGCPARLLGRPASRPCYEAERRVDRD